MASDLSPIRTSAFTATKSHSDLHRLLGDSLRLLHNLAEEGRVVFYRPPKVSVAIIIIIIIL